MSGRIDQINVSNGGVPKRPVRSAKIGDRGVDGDAQNDLVHHGSPDQALCLYSSEVIEALQQEGHPIFAGAAGENLTLGGLDWKLMRPGLVLRIGTEVVAEVTFPATPCSKNAAWFAERNFRRMSEDLHPGWSRWYAKVTTAGEVAVGDPVLID